MGVIQQLEKTGNRPHLLKELGAVLANSISIVESSANPSAIISSRLATYLRRPWTALSRCPLDRVLVGTHPKRVYYYLTTCPHQPIPSDSPEGPSTARIISPSLSSAASEEEEELDARTRSQLSPSPELDLSSPEFEDDSTPFSNRNPLMRSGTHPPTSSNISHNRRAVSPPLERDEREFTQTASSLQQRSRSRDVEAITALSGASQSAGDTAMDDLVPADIEETEESAALRNSEAAAALFGQMHAMQHGFAASSPLLKPQLEIEISRVAFRADSDDVRMGGEEEFGCWSEDLKSPENIELDELEDLFGEY